MKIEYVCSLPGIDSALAFGGPGAKIKIDIPETEMTQASKLIMARGKVIRVTMEWDDGEA